MSEYFANSLEKESEEMEQIKTAVREAGVFIVLGYSERYQGTLYISQVGHLFLSLLVAKNLPLYSPLSMRPAPLFFTDERSSQLTLREHTGATGKPIPSRPLPPPHSVISVV